MYTTLAKLCSLSLVVSLFFGSPGPLLTLQGFHPGMLKWCSMHTLNLGLVFVANAAALKLTCSYCRVHQLLVKKSQWFEKGTSQSKYIDITTWCYLLVKNSQWFEKRTSQSTYLSGVLHIAYAAVQILLIEPRLLLTEDLAYFGHGTFAQQLDEAYRAFTAFCKSKKIRHTQPPFTPKMVTWRCILRSWYLIQWYNIERRGCFGKLSTILYYNASIHVRSDRNPKVVNSCAPRNHNYPEVKRKMEKIYSQPKPTMAELWFMVGAVYVTRGRNASRQSNCGAYSSCNELWLWLIHYIIR